MFNRKYVLSRIERAREQHIPMTNYGVAIAFLNGILDQINIKKENLLFFYFEANPKVLSNFGVHFIFMLRRTLYIN